MVYFLLDRYMTELFYLKEPDVFTLEVRILNILKVNDLQWGLVFDRTIFYVQGGGQPSDKGIVISEDKNLDVLKVYRDGDQIIHLIEGTSGLEKGMSMKLKVDKPARTLHSKIHSAGHLIDVAVKNLNLDLMPGNGYHYPNGSYVSYEIGYLFKNSESLLEDLQLQLESLINKDIRVLIDIDNQKKLYGQPLRMVSFEGFDGCPCGGTHVLSTKVLAGLKILKIKVKKSKLKVSYSL